LDALEAFVTPLKTSRESIPQEFANLISVLKLSPTIKNLERG